MSRRSVKLMPLAQAIGRALGGQVAALKDGKELPDATITPAGNVLA
jgi:hypothetical protein